MSSSRSPDFSTTGWSWGVTRAASRLRSKPPWPTTRACFAAQPESRPRGGEVVGELFDRQSGAPRRSGLLRRAPRRHERRRSQRARVSSIARSARRSRAGENRRQHHYPLSARSTASITRVAPIPPSIRFSRRSLGREHAGMAVLAAGLARRAGRKSDLTPVADVGRDASEPAHRFLRALVGHARASHARREGTDRAGILTAR